MPQLPEQPANSKQIRFPKKSAPPRQQGIPSAPPRRVANERPSWERGAGQAPGSPANVDPARERMPYNPVPQTQESQGGGAAWGQVGLGALMAGGGTIGTVASYSAASPGGRYTVFYGLIVVGIITLVKGFASLGK